MKYLKILILPSVVFSGLLVSGCSISNETIVDAIKACEKNGGLVSIRVNGHGPGVDVVTCGNGASFKSRK